MTNDILRHFDMRALGRELQHARKQQGIRQEDAAKIINAARTTIVAIEKGERRIRSEELVKLARAYQRPISDFVRARPSVEPFRTVQFRGPSVPSEEEAEQIAICISVLEDLCRDYLELEQIADRPLSQRYLPEYRRDGAQLDLEAEALSQKERHHLGLGDGPLHILRDYLEDIGLRIFYVPLKPSRLSAIYYYDDQLGGCIAINSNHPEERCRFSLAHDYCHFLADRHHPSVSVIQGYQRVPESERFADAFAQYFVLPTSDLTQRFMNIRTKGSVTPNDLIILAHRYGVSFEALVLRLEDMRLLRTGTHSRIMEGGFRVRSAQAILKLEAIPARRDMFPLHYRNIAVEAYERELISEGQLAQFLRIDRSSARQIAGGVTKSPLSAEQSPVTKQFRDFLEEGVNEQ